MKMLSKFAIFLAIFTLGRLEESQWVFPFNCNPIQCDGDNQLSPFGVDCCLDCLYNHGASSGGRCYKVFCVCDYTNFIKTEYRKEPCPYPVEYYDETYTDQVKP